MLQPCSQRLTEVCRANGGVYVKAGQFAAAFGAVPMEYRKHLALLQVSKQQH
jgi:aarF domain-containing kinase